MKPIKVGYLMTNLRVGGAERQILALAAGLPKDTFRPEILVTSGPGPLDGQAAAAGIPIRYLGARALSNAPLPARIVGRLDKTFRYVAQTRRRRFDIIDAWLYPEDVLAVLTRFATRVPIVLSGRRDLLPRSRTPVVGAIVDIAISHFADMIVANSAAVADHAVRAHRANPTKVRTIRNGVALIEPLGPDERRGVRASFGVVSDDLLVIGCVANYREVKRHAMLIDAFAELARGRDDLRLVLVGEGPLRADIERQVGLLGLDDRVIVHGQVLDARPLYGAFDVVAQASRTEGLPNVLLEAAAAGRPIVATAAGGSEEIVLDGETGLLVPVDDKGAFVAALQRATDDPALRERLGVAARRRIAMAFGMDRFIGEWRDLYEELVTAARGRRAAR